MSESSNGMYYMWWYIHFQMGFCTSYPFGKMTTICLCARAHSPLRDFDYRCDHTIAAIIRWAHMQKKKHIKISTPHRHIVPSCRVAATLRSSAASASLAPFVELHVPRGARSSFVGRAQHAASIHTPTDIHSFLIRIRIIQIRARSLTANQSPVSPHTYIHHQPRIAVYLFGKYIYEYVHIYMLKLRPPSWILCLVIKGFAQCARRYPHIIKSQHLHNLDKSLPLSCIYMPAYRRAERLLCARYYTHHESTYVSATLFLACATWQCNCITCDKIRLHRLRILATQNCVMRMVGAWGVAARAAWH